MIYNSHGIIADELADRFQYRSQAPASRFEAYLSARASKFVSLEAALQGRGDALTIDDATEASAEAAEMCLNLGHAVTLFINPGYVANASPYFFALLDQALEYANHTSFRAWGYEFYLGERVARLQARATIKNIYRSIAEEEQRQALLQSLLKQLGQPRFEIEKPAQTVSIGKLKELISLGVVVGNHGWTHGEMAAMPVELALKEILKGRQWIHDNLACRCYVYAVPFGQTYRSDVATLSNSYWLLARNYSARGSLSDRLFNRCDFTEDPAWLSCCEAGGF